MGHQASLRARTPGAIGLPSTSRLISLNGKDNRKIQGAKPLGPHLRRVRGDDARQRWAPGRVETAPISRLEAQPASAAPRETPNLSGDLTP